MPKLENGDIKHSIFRDVPNYFVCGDSIFPQNQLWQCNRNDPVKVTNVPIFSNTMRHLSLIIQKFGRTLNFKENTSVLSINTMRPGDTNMCHLTGTSLILQQ